MWTLKCIFNNKKNILNKLTNKYNLILKGYPVNTHKEKEKLIVSAAGFIEGVEENKKLFLKELKKQKEITNIENYKDFFIISIIQPKETHCLYGEGLIYTKPVTVTPNFTQEYEVSHFNRKRLEKVMSITKQNLKPTILKIKNEKLKEISFLGIHPNLTEKQKEALHFAHKNNYYDFPRKSSLKSLSKDNNQPLSTFQKNLRKAEKKIMDFFLKV
ncbi:MAG: helix-turn-helix domain-containing protein [Nanoarchaeota archaeon]|jgi:predicted DNA binding protein|nr:helix-turn-helix domain-containing protein [Nanoarchaeota archaeon]